MLVTSKFRLVTHMISYFFFNYIHQILVHCHSACFCNHTLDRFTRNMNITLITLERICKYPDCTPDDVIKFTGWNCRPPFPFGWGGLQYFYTDFPYVLIKNALSMYGRPVQLYVSILILETVSPILHEMSHSLMVCRSVSMVCVFCSFSINRTVYNNISFTHLLR